MQGVPMVVLANKQDLINALRAAEVRRLYGTSISSSVDVQCHMCMQKGIVFA